MDSTLTDRTPPASASMAPASEAPAPARRPHAPGTRVRQLVFSSKAERHAATLVLTRSFAYDGNVQRYLGGVKAPGVDRQPTTLARGDISKLPIEARCLYYLFAGLLTTTAITGGRVMLVVEPAVEPSSDEPRDWLVIPHMTGEASKRMDADKVEKSVTAYERVLAVALWHYPGSDTEGIAVAFKARQDRTITGGGILLRGWGIRGLMRSLDLQTKFVKSHKAACKQRKIDYSTCWTLGVLGTDPDADGRGYGALAIREGLAHIDSQSPAQPCLIEASQPRPKAIYEHFGWEETSTIVFGAGKVDADGFVCGTDVQRPGVTTWTMFRPAQV